VASHTHHPQPHPVKEDSSCNQQDLSGHSEKQKHVNSDLHSTCPIPIDSCHQSSWSQLMRGCSWRVVWQRQRLTREQPAKRRQPW
jgi:hypothetical protein